jgi:4-methyl-5(b-hydroxyethyl)-thiazole monophosphate biosynthesis
MKAYIFLAEGFEEIEAITVIDVLRRAGVDIKAVSVSDKLAVTGAHKITVVADALFEEIDYADADMLVLPGGMPGTTNLASHRRLTQIISQHVENGKWVGAICAAPSILGQLGILKGKSAACYPGFEASLQGADVKYDSVVQDGNVITARGPGVSALFALKLVEVLAGSEVSKKIKSGMLL